MTVHIQTCLEKFAERIQELNEKAFVLIKSTKFQEALLYLAEA